MISGLVSILCPCYNVAPYIDRFIDSLLQQTYKHLEIIFVNDGSTDETPEIIRKRTPELESQGYVVRLVGQKNEGLSSAINTGLKYFNGQYLSWPDPDDWLAPESIEERVSLFESHPHVGTIRCNGELIEDTSLKSLGFFTKRSEEHRILEGLFFDLSHIKTYFAPVCYMVRSEYFLAVNPERYIYHSREAMQNLQMLLPITHAYPSMHIDKPLGFYLVRGGSLSRSSKSADDLYKWDSVMCHVALDTLSRISNLENNYTESLSRFFVRYKLAPAAYRARAKKDFALLLESAGLTRPISILCLWLARFRNSYLSELIERISLGFSSKVENFLFIRLITL
jgi:glycosyltransferase involved in cell wall biosynthesis